MIPIEKTRALAKEQDSYFKIQALTVEQREEYIKWIDQVNSITNNLVYAAYSDAAWDNEDQQTTVILVGNSGQVAELPKGLFFIYPSDYLSADMNNAVALAFAHFMKIPDHIIFIPQAVSVVINKPSAHERFAARMFINELIANNSDNQEIQEWANKLAEQA